MTIYEQIGVMNNRAPKMMEIIARGVDLSGASILDLGCGFGDLCAIAVAKYGADSVALVDMYATNVNIALDKVQRFTPNVVGMIGDLNNKSLQSTLVGLSWSVDYVFCTSVLPYVADREELLNLLEDFDNAIIECQYAGDGPGFKDIKNDKDMKALLQEHFLFPIKLGETKRDDTGASRSIWLAKQ